MRLIKVTSVEPLADPEIWNLAHVERGVVTWNDELDLAPEFLYARVHELEPPETGEDVTVNQLVVTMRELRAFAGRSRVRSSGTLRNEAGLERVLELWKPESLRQKRETPVPAPAKNGRLSVWWGLLEQVRAFIVRPGSEVRMQIDAFNLVFGGALRTGGRAP